MRRPAQAVLVLLTLTGVVAACNVPVFRYALERWPPDEYTLTVYHREPLTVAQAAAIEALRPAEEPAGTNVVVATSDAARARPGDLSADALLPQVVVRFPQAAGGRLGWSGPLATSGRGLYRSPARDEIARRLGTGTSAVWIQLTSGDAPRDEAVARLLDVELRRLQTELRLPERTAAAADQLLGEDRLPLRLDFSLLQVRRDDPTEAVLVHLLLRSEPDLEGRKDPLVFPVFGRGRVLYALAGAGITSENLAEAARYLTGACSCEAKRQHPGVDLLMTADWDAPFRTETAPVRPRGTTPTAEVVTEPTRGTRTWLEAAVVVSGLLVLATGFWTWRAGRRRDR